MMMVFPDEEGPNSFERSTVMVRMSPFTFISTFFIAQSPYGSRAGRARALLPVLERHVVGADQLVAARLPGQPPVGAVEIDLLVYGNGGRLLHPELVDLVVLGEALLLVHLRLRLFRHAVEIVVVPVDEEGRRLEERHVDGLGI